MKKYKVSANIEIEVPISSYKVTTKNVGISFEILAESESEAEEFLQNRIQFDYNFKITEA